MSNLKYKSTKQGVKTPGGHYLPDLKSAAAELNRISACAKELAAALRRCSLECNDIDHSGGFYHDWDDKCQIEEKVKKAVDNYENLWHTAELK